MYKVKRFNEKENRMDKLLSEKDREEIKREARELVNFVNKNYGKTMEILGK